MNNRVTICWMVTIFFLSVLILSCSSPKVPRYVDFKINRFEMIDKDYYKIYFELEVENYNSKQHEILLNELLIYKLEKNIVGTIDDINNYDFSQLQLSNQNPISHLEEPIKIILAANTNTIIELDLVFQKDVLITSVLSFFLNFEIDFLFRGNFVFYHWTGEYKIPFNQHMLLDLKQLFK